MNATKQKKRANGEGTKPFQRDGRWIGVVSVGFKPDGRRNRKWVYGKTQAEVVEKMSRMRVGKLDGTLPCGDSKQTVGQYLDHWLENVIKPNTRETTYASLSYRVRVWIKPILGPYKLAKLTGSDIEWLYGQMKKDGRSGAARRMAHGLLRTALKNAVRKKLIPFNPTNDVDAPRAETREMKCLDREQTQAFIEAVKGRRMEALFIVAVSTGMRLGELRGLTRDDIDLKAGTVAVKRTLAYTGGKFVVNPPKTKAGLRTVTLPQVAIDALRSHYARMMADGHAGSQYVFCSKTGGPTQSAAHMWSFRAVLKQAGLPVIRFHDLRHTCASLMLAAGINPRVVQERLGHSNVSITLGTYGHVYRGQDAEAARTFDELMAVAG